MAKVLRGEAPEDRLPVLECTHWSELTLRQWERQGLREGLSAASIKREVGLDVDHHHWFHAFDWNHAHPTDGQVWVRESRDYDRVLPALYPRPAFEPGKTWARNAAEQARGEAVVWFTLAGFFWWPRFLFGPEAHFYAFYDHPELIHRMNSHLLAYHLQCLEEFCSLCTPEFVALAEDMASRSGPLLSKELFDEFLAPYYRQVADAFHRRGVPVLVDSDGWTDPMARWLVEAGLDGLMPLESCSGCDVPKLRLGEPGLVILGAFDRRTLTQGEEALEAEVERLIPALRAGRTIPAADGQVAQDVSLRDYRNYVRRLKDAAERAVRI